MKHKDTTKPISRGRQRDVRRRRFKPVCFPSCRAYSKNDDKRRVHKEASREGEGGGNLLKGEGEGARVSLSQRPWLRPPEVQGL